LEAIVRLTLLLSLSLLVVAPVRADAPVCESPALWSFPGLDGSRFELTIPGAAFQGAAAWRLGSGEPPLSIAKVVRIATSWAATHRGRFDELHLTEVSIHPVSCTLGVEYWYYAVKFYPVLDHKLLDDREHVIGILMDGRIFEPQKASAGS
jgi:hypothetical protein